MGLLDKLFPKPDLKSDETVAYCVRDEKGSTILISKSADECDRVVCDNPDCEFVVVQVACRALTKGLKREIVYREV